MRLLESLLGGEVVKGRRPFDTPPGRIGSPPSSDPLALLNWALQRDPDDVMIINFAGSVLWCSRGQRGPAGHGGEQGPPLGPHVAVAVPPGVVANLEGPPEYQDAYILIHIDRRAVDAMDEPPPLLILPPGLARPS